MGKKISSKKPTIPKSPWDMGQNTLAQNYMTVTEERGETDPKTGKKSNPNGVKGKRRISVVELYHRQDHITAKQLQAAEALMNAYERTLRTPPAVKEVNVDSSPKPDKATSIKIDRLSGFHRLYKRVPARCKRVIDRVVLENERVFVPRKARGATAQRIRNRAYELLAEGLEELAEYV